MRERIKAINMSLPPMFNVVKENKSLVLEMLTKTNEFDTNGNQVVARDRVKNLISGSTSTMNHYLDGMLQMIEIAYHFKSFTDMLNEEKVDVEATN